MRVNQVDLTLTYDEFRTMSDKLIFPNTVVEKMDQIAKRIAAVESTLIQPKRHKAEPGECQSCDDYRAEGTDFHPPHDASDRCESGKHNHCSCDTCF